MQTLIVVLVVGAMMLLVALILELRTFRHVVVRGIDELRELRLTSRARVSDFAVRSGEAPRERELRRLGRASSGKRVVVGGDDDSDLNRSMARAAQRGRLEKEEDDDE